MGGEDDLPLPPGWSRGWSKSNKKTFYFHKDTNHTQWHFPTVNEAKDPLMAKKRAEMNKEREKKRLQNRPKDDHQNGGSKRPHASTTSSSKPISKKTRKNDDDFLELADATSVAVIVPFRDLHAAQKRAEHLSKFVPHMHQFFGKLKQRGLVSDYHIYIVEQSNDERKFNRGKLLNIGFDVAAKHHTKTDPKGRRHPPHDVFIFHDVDLLPNDDLAEWYAKFPSKPLHIARVWGRYSNNPKYFGGIVSFSKSDYKRINGYPNTFWGWGGEDDEMQKRLERLGIKFESPPKGTIRDLEEMTLQEKLAFLKKNREWKCMVKWEALDEHEATWKTNGMNNLNYKILKTEYMDGTNKASRITTDVQLNPNNHWANAKAGVDFMG